MAFYLRAMSKSGENNSLIGAIALPPSRTVEGSVGRHASRSGSLAGDIVSLQETFKRIGDQVENCPFAAADALMIVSGLEQIGNGRNLTMSGGQRDPRELIANRGGPGEFETVNVGDTVAALMSGREIGQRADENGKQRGAIPKVKMEEAYHAGVVGDKNRGIRGNVGDSEGSQI